MKQDLGKLLLENGQITYPELELAAQETAGSGEPLGRALIRLGLVNEDNIKTVLELHYAVNYLNLKKIAPDRNLISRLPSELILEHGLIPINKEDNRLMLAMLDPSDSWALDQAKTCFSDLQIRPVVCSDDSFQDFIDRAAVRKPAAVPAAMPAAKPAAPPKAETAIVKPKEVDIPESGFISLEDELGPNPNVDGDRAIVRLCNHILSNALSRGCTNIHIEPVERQILVHYRKEGVLFAARKLPISILADLITRFKNMSSAGNVEQSLPYDGRLGVSHSGQNFFFRLSIVPGAYGEHLVIWLE